MGVGEGYQSAAPHDDCSTQSAGETSLFRELESARRSRRKPVERKALLWTRPTFVIRLRCTLTVLRRSVGSIFGSSRTVPQKSSCIAVSTVSFVGGCGDHSTPIMPTSHPTRVSVTASTWWSSVAASAVSLVRSVVPAPS
jgi:hypothetical protein